MKLSRAVFTMAAAGAAAMPTAPVAAAPGEVGLVGTWRLIRYENIDSRGTVSRPFGEQPKGHFIYGATGYLSIQIMRTPPTSPFASGDDRKGSDAEVRSAYDGYSAYFGTYRVDAAKHLLTHVIEGSLRPSFTGTEQLRPYRLRGDTLIIEVKGRDGFRYYRELHRVR